MKEIVIYGAYGYTGKLITTELLAMGIHPVLAGRNREKLAAFSKDKDLPFKTVSLEDAGGLRDLLENTSVVIHAAGPFSATARPMIEACIATGTHYTDITGEWEVYEYARSRSEDARISGIMLLPGAGFDVVPSDCLAKHLKGLLPDATSLRLAFVTRKASVSRGTAKTMIEGASEGQIYRKDHQLRSRSLGSSTIMVDFGDFEQECAGISWGDISTAYTSTGIPNIEVFTGVSSSQLKKLRWAGRISFLLGIPFVKSYLKKQVDKRPPGPDRQRREKGEAWFWGQVSDGKVTVEMRLKTPEGYSLTAMTASKIAMQIVDGNYKTGYQTPSTAYGETYITTFPGCSSFF